MTSDMPQRMLPMASGKRVGLTLDNATWHAIDHLAASDATTWQRWCSQVLANHSGRENMTQTVRTAVTDALLTRLCIDERAKQMALPQPALLRLSGIFQDAEFDADIAKAQWIDGVTDLGGMEVTSGADQMGRACLWLRNGLRGQTHIVIPLPYTPDEIETRLDGNT